MNEQERRRLRWWWWLVLFAPTILSPFIPVVAKVFVPPGGFPIGPVILGTLSFATLNAVTSFGGCMVVGVVSTALST